VRALPLLSRGDGVADRPNRRLCQAATHDCRFDRVDAQERRSKLAGQRLPESGLAGARSASKHDEQRLAQHEAVQRPLSRSS